MKPKYSKHRRYTSIEKLGNDSDETRKGGKGMPSLYAAGISSRDKHASDGEENESFIASIRKSSDRDHCSHQQPGQGQTKAFSTNATENKVSKVVRQNSMKGSKTILHGDRIEKEKDDSLKISNTTKKGRNKRKNSTMQTDETSEEEDDLARNDRSISRLRKETEMNEILKTFVSVKSISMDQLTAIYRTLVRVKGEHLNLKTVADVMKYYLHIEIANEDQEHFLDNLEQHEDLFTIEFGANEPLISPKTNIEVCSIFTTDTDKQHECNNLHICKYFLLSKCPLKKCKFGHYLRTSHNSRVLRNSGLDGLEQGCILTLIRNIGSRNSSTLPLLCKFYNNEGNCSKRSQCRHLHICKHYINEDCKFGKKCVRCHNLLAKQPISVLKRYGLTPDSDNYRKIMRLIKGTLQHGGVLLKREIQSINSLHKCQLTSDEDSESNVTCDSSQSGDDESVETDDSEEPVDNTGRDLKRKQEGNGCLERKYSERDDSNWEHPETDHLERNPLETDHFEKEQLGKGRAESENPGREHPGREHSERDRSKIKHPGRGLSERDNPSELEQLEREHSGKDRSERECSERDRSKIKNPGRGLPERDNRSELEQLEREHSGKDRSEREHSGKDRSEREHSGKDRSGRECSERDRSKRGHTGRQASDKDHSEREHTGTYCGDVQTGERTISVMSFQLQDKVFRIRHRNGRWQLADLSDTWADMRENEADEFLKLKDDFIRLAEKIVLKAQEKTVGNAKA